MSKALAESLAALPDMGIRLGYFRKSTGKTHSSWWLPGDLREKYILNLVSDPDVLRVWWRVNAAKLHYIKGDPPQSVPSQEVKTSMASAPNPSRNQAIVAVKRIENATQYIHNQLMRGAWLQSDMEEALNEIDGCSAILRDFNAGNKDD